MQAEDTERSAQEIARELKERYRRNRTAYDGSANFTDRKANMPGPTDPKLWQVRCKSGSERNIINTIFMKLIGAREREEDVDVFSAFQRDSLPGMIFIEAFRAQHVQVALQGIANIYLNQNTAQRQGTGPNPIQLVENRDMVALLTMKKKTTDVKVGMWVRIKRGKYTGDLAKVKEIMGDGLSVAVDLVPRIDYNPDRTTSKKKKTGAAAVLNRPPQRLFAPEDVAEIYGRGSVSRRQGRHFFMNEEYIDGLLDKEYPITSLQVDDVKPSLAEISKFHSDNPTDMEQDLKSIADQATETMGTTILPGDQVEATEGELKGLSGTVDSVSKDIVTVKIPQIELGGAEEIVEMPLRGVRKVFKAGDHVKVMQGRNLGDSGLVLSVDGNLVNFYSDLGKREVHAFARDLRVAAEVGASNNKVGEFELHDLVMVDPQTAGVIFQVERDAFKVLDQNGSVRSLQPHQINSRPAHEAKKAVGLDKEDREFRVGDQMKEADGEAKRGVVLHIYRGLFAFLHSRETTANNGIFVVRSKNLLPLDARVTAQNTGPDYSKQDPTLNKNLPTNLGSMGPNLRHLINTPIVVVRGTHKGLRGVIKDTTGDKARVELATNNRVVTLGFESLKKKDPVTGIVTPLEVKRMGTYQLPSQSVQTPAVMGGMTPGFNPYSRPGGMTPAINPYALPGGMTPAAVPYGQTPNPYAMQGGRTPAPMGFGQTPNPYAIGGRTPAYGVGGQTPYGAAAGGKTPYGAGGQTPYGAGGRTPYGR